MNWPKRKAGELFDIQLGKMLNEKARKGDTFSYLANFNVRWGKFDLLELNQMAFSDREKEKFTLQPNDLLMCEGGEIGRCAVWLEKGSKVFYQKALHRLRPIGEQMNSHFMYYYMHYLSAMGDLPKLVGETSIAHLTREKLVTLLIPVPARDTQDKIVEVLLTWDAAIEKTERLIAVKESHYTHELSRLISQGQHPRSHVGNFAHEVSERNRGGNDERVLSVTNSRGFVLPEDQFERRVASADLSNYKVVTRGQYAYNPSRINVGSIARLDDWDMGVLSPMYVVFGLDNAKVNSDYFLHWLDSHEARERIKKSAQGSVRETVSFTEFAAIAYPLPDLDRQIAIAHYLNTLREEISTLGVYVEKLKEQKRGLMQKLLTGQWRVYSSKGVG